MFVQQMVYLHPTFIVSSDFLALYLLATLHFTIRHFVSDFVVSLCLSFSVPLSLSLSVSSKLASVHWVQKVQPCSAQLQPQQEQKLTKKTHILEAKAKLGSATCSWKGH